MPGPDGPDIRQEHFLRSQYIVMSKPYINEIMGDLDRIISCITINDARESAEALKQKLRKKFQEQLDWSKKKPADPRWAAFNQVVQQNAL